MKKIITLQDAFERIDELERGLRDSKSANKRIKQETRYLDYNRLLTRFNRQKNEHTDMVHELQSLRNNFQGNIGELLQEMDTILSKHQKE